MKEKSKKTEQINVKTTPEVKAMVEKLAEKEERTLSYVVHALLSNLLKNPPKKIPKVEN